MNYLDLCSRLVREAGIAEGGVASVKDQTGIKEKAVQWVRRAWLEIQNEKDWNFLWNIGFFDTVEGKSIYSPTNDLVLNPALKNWDRHSFHVNDLNIGYIPWGQFDKRTQTPSRPFGFTIRPDNSIQFTAPPNGVYPVNFEYFRTAQELSENEDIPIIGSQHHEIIFYKAMMYLAAEQDAPELSNDAAYNLRMRMQELRDSYLPDLVINFNPIA